MAKLGIIADINQHHNRRWLPYFFECNEVVLISARPATKAAETQCHEFLRLHQKNKNFKYIYLPLTKSKIFSYFSFIKSLRRIIKEEKIELLYLQGIGLPSFLASFSSRLPMMLCPWGSDLLFFPQKQLLSRLMAKRLVRRSNTTVSISNIITKRCIEYGAAPDKIKAIPMGANLDVFKPGISVNGLRQKFKLTDNERIVLSVRNFAPLYNIDTIIKSIPLVLEKAPNTRFLLLGGHGARKDYMKEMKELIASLDIAQHVIIVDYLPSEEIPKIYNLADIILSVPSSDAFPCSLHEAMACKVPPVVSDLPAMADFFKDGDNAYIVPVRNHEKLAEATITLLADDEKRKQIANYNYNLVKQKADAKKNVKELEALFRALVK